ncbi:alpha/beta fold hydrolase [Pseudonocardia sp. ICBG162]|uniref:alpha/beta fold hydrolase n=1 Tax=Pseudonocardia sp. ICBG162 TaxID=2846761 RepID=UPI001CF646B7|nr:alpha/beta hydrolase [Pseudonocardia sp. ICBG162]
MIEAVHVGGAGTPLVLLHGATSSWRAWRPVLPALERRHRVLAPNLAGHHGGPAVTGRPDQVVPAIVDAVATAMDDAGVGTAHLVGNSLGGWVALELARRGRARSVVALSPAGAWAEPADLDRLLRLFRAGGRLGRVPGARVVLGVRPLRRLLLRQVAEHPELLTRFDVDDLVDDLAGCEVLADLLAGASRAGALRPFTPDCPVLIAWGERDRMLPFARYGRPMLDAVHGAQLVRVPGVGHVPMGDAPRLVSSLVLRFTARADRAARAAEVPGPVSGAGRPA